MRKNIFQLLQDNFDYHTEITRINELFEQVMFFKTSWVSPEDFVDFYIFPDWKNRNRCIDTDDMKEQLKIDQIIINENTSIDDVLVYLEYVENILRLAWNYVNNNDECKYYSDYNTLRQNLDFFLDNINCQAYYFDNDEMVLIEEKNASATAVAEIVDDKTSLKIIKYNHYALKGDIHSKKDIILELASQLEPKRRTLENLDKKLASNLFYLLNNLNLRHNNVDKESKGYKAAVAKMRKNTLEQWYDEIYQLELLAFLLLDNIKRNKKIDALKVKLEG